MDGSHDAWVSRLDAWTSTVEQGLLTHLDRQRRVTLEKLLSRRVRESYEKALSSPERAGLIFVESKARTALSASAAARRGWLTRRGILPPLGPLTDGGGRKPTKRTTLARPRRSAASTMIVSPAAPVKQRRTPGQMSARALAAYQANGQAAGMPQPSPQVASVAANPPQPPPPVSPSTTVTAGGIQINIAGVAGVAPAPQPTPFQSRIPPSGPGVSQAALNDLSTMGPASSYGQHQRRLNNWISGNPERKALAEAAGTWIGDFGWYQNAQYTDPKLAAQKLAGVKRAQSATPSATATRQAKVLMKAAAEGPNHAVLHRGITVSDGDLAKFVPGYTFTEALSGWTMNEDVAEGYGNLRLTKHNIKTNIGGNPNVVMIEVHGANGVHVTPLYGGQGSATGTPSYMKGEEVLLSGEFEVVSVTQQAPKNLPGMNQNGVVPGGGARKAITKVVVRKKTRGYDPDKPGQEYKDAVEDLDTLDLGPLSQDLWDLSADEMAAMWEVTPPEVWAWLLHDWADIAEDAGEPWSGPDPYSITHPGDLAPEAKDWHGEWIGTKAINPFGLTEIGAWVRNLFADSLTFLTAIFGDFGKSTSKDLTGRADFDPGDPAVVQAIHDQAELLSQWAQDIFDQVNDVISAGEAGDVPLDQIADDVNAVFDDARAQAPQIALAASHSAANSATYLAGWQAGIPVEKTWVSKKDNKVRPWHVHADTGNPIGMSDRFDVGVASGGDWMLFPGDPTAKPGNLWGCRCELRITPVAGKWLASVEVKTGPAGSMRRLAVQANAVDVIDTAEDLANGVVGWYVNSVDDEGFHNDGEKALRGWAAANATLTAAERSARTKKGWLKRKRARTVLTGRERALAKARPGAAGAVLPSAWWIDDDAAGTPKRAQGIRPSNIEPPQGHVIVPGKPVSIAVQPVRPPKDVTFVGKTTRTPDQLQKDYGDDPAKIMARISTMLGGIPVNDTTGAPKGGREEYQKATMMAAAAQAIDEWTQEYPNLKTDIRRVTFNGAGSYAGLVRSDAAGMALSLSLPEIKAIAGMGTTDNPNPITLVPQMAVQAEDMQWSPRMARSAYGVTIHELGHVTDFHIRTERNGGKWDPSSFARYRAPQKGFTIEDQRAATPSPYGQANRAEQFAERFAADWLGMRTSEWEHDGRVMRAFRAYIDANTKQKNRMPKAVKAVRSRTRSKAVTTPAVRAATVPFPDPDPNRPEPTPSKDWGRLVTPAYREWYATLDNGKYDGSNRVDAIRWAQSWDGGEAVRALRTNTPIKDYEKEDLLALHDIATEAPLTTADVVLIRNAVLDPDDYPVGSTYTERGYQSTTGIEGGLPQFGGLTFEVEVPKGNTVLAIPDEGEEDVALEALLPPGGYEVIANDGTTVRVRLVKQEPHGKVRDRIERIGEPEPVGDDAWEAMEDIALATNLTAAENAAFDHYTGGGYVQMNAVLRKGEDREGAQAKVESMIRAMYEKYPPLPAMEVHRGASMRYEFVPGESFIDNGFTSTSTDPAIAFSGRYKFVINVPEGTIGAPGNDQEQEVILAPGTKYRIDSVEDLDGDYGAAVLPFSGLPATSIQAAIQADRLDELLQMAGDPDADAVLAEYNAWLAGENDPTATIGVDLVIPNKQRVTLTVMEQPTLAETLARIGPEAKDAEPDADAVEPLGRFVWHEGDIEPA